MPVIDTVFHESKCFKNEPKPQSYVTKPASENDSAQYRTGYMVTPANSIDLLKIDKVVLTNLILKLIVIIEKILKILMFIIKLFVEATLFKMNQEKIVGENFL